MKHPSSNVPRIRSILPLVTTSLLLSSWAPTASARLFLDPTGGTSLIHSASPEDHIQDYPLAITPYFGVGGYLTSYVSENGNLYYGTAPQSDHHMTQLGSTGFNQIAPLWQDFKLGATGSVSVKSTANWDYTAVTWQDMELDHTDYPGLTGSFQAIIFENNTTLNGVNFLAGDIVFSYHALNFFVPGIEFSIGLQSEANDLVFAPGNETDHFEGWYSPSLFGSFPYADDEYLLFRASGNTYLSSIETMEAIPEPSTLAALVSGSLLLGWRSLRRRQG